MMTKIHRLNGTALRVVFGVKIQNQAPMTLIKQLIELHSSGFWVSAATMVNSKLGSVMVSLEFCSIRVSRCHFNHNS